MPGLFERGYATKIVKNIFTITPTITLLIDIKNACRNSILPATNLYDSKVKSIGMNFTIPEPTAALELKDIASRFIMGIKQVTAVNIKNMEFNILNVFLPMDEDFKIIPPFRF